MIYEHKEFSSLIDILQWRAANQPDRLAFRFLMEDGVQKSVTYSDLDNGARALAVLLQNKHSIGSRALLLYQAGPDYITAFFGCIYAGILPVPAYPPRLNGNLSRLEAIIADSDASVALTTVSNLANIESRFTDSPRLTGLNWVVTDHHENERLLQWEPPMVGRNSLAFLQYTSGSTSSPKGVMLTHGNLLHNLKLIGEMTGTNDDTVSVSWLPPYHDMGLIGMILHPIFSGYPVTLMKPVDFIQSPFRWLHAISEFGATLSTGPNFAYDLCLKKITPEQRDMLDLSRWKQALSGAETVRHETIERFTEYFAPCGFRKETFYPCYGLAEGTLFVAGGVPSELPISNNFENKALQENHVIKTHVDIESRTLVSCGRLSLLSHRVIIVNPETLTPCSGDQVGEIWVSGPSVASGYWNRSEQTKETFEAYLADSGEGPFLRTGDLGFIYDDELYITGRIKDVIIIRGRNYYPQDIEFSVQQSHPAIANNNGAAFSVTVQGEERLVVVQELERQHRRANLQEVVVSVRKAVSEQHQLQVYAVVLIKPVSIPKTSSGKIQRHACRDHFLSGALKVVYSDTLDVSNEVNRNESVSYGLIKHKNIEDYGQRLLSEKDPTQRKSMVENDLLERFADILGVKVTQEYLHNSLYELGIDSIMVIELKNELENYLGIDFPLSRLLDGLSISELAGEICSQLDTKPKGSQEENTSTIMESKRTLQLSYGQSAMWSLQQLAPESTMYHITGALRLTGELDVVAVQNVFRELVKRHPLLRVRYELQKEDVVQIIEDDPRFLFSYHDATNWTEQFLHDQFIEVNHPFDLTRDERLRVHLFQRSEREHVLFITVHHIIADLWSMSVLFQEWIQLYTAFKEGREFSLPLPASNYTTHIETEKSLLQSSKGQNLWTYWKNQLSGETPILDLPTDRPRPPVQTYHGSSYTFQLPASLTSQIRKLSQQNNMTLYTALLAVYQILIHRYSGQEDLLVGSPTLGRRSSKETNVIGYYANPVVIRSRLSADLSFKSFLKQVRQTVLEAIEHQDYPFPLLVERLQLKRSANHSPLFQTMFTFQKSQGVYHEIINALTVNTSSNAVEVNDLLMEAISLEQRFVQFDLTLSMAEVSGALVGKFEYNTDLFERSTIQRMASHFENLLFAVVQDPYQSISKLPILSEKEYEQLFVEFNDTKVPYSKEKAIHELFEEQVNRTPDRVAVVFEGESLTYRELNSRANQLARFLQKQGMETGALVGLCFERSFEMVIGILGVLKAGGAYVPLDPVYPQERLTFILEDSQISMVLTQERLTRKFLDYQPRIICLDCDIGRFELEENKNVETELTGNSIAYVIYTSGSTGQPKGCMGTHGGIVNRLMWMQEKFQLAELDRVLQKTPYSFDVSIWEVFSPLIAGARLVISRPEGHRDSTYLIDVIVKQEITMIHFVPSMLKAFLMDQEVERCSSLQHVMCSGEALPYELQEEFFNKMGARLHNLYGPTEASIEVTHWECKRSSDYKFVPMGRPISNIKLYVLDKQMQLVPIGVPGELYIGGGGLAKGYLNRPELTAERFISNPFNDEPGSRLYKTGDLVRYLPDGNLEYLGRIDNQVKIRGFRIELGEIETALGTHPAVQETVVIAREEISGDKRLTAYIVPSHKAKIDTRDLRNHLREKLPEYMVPSAFVLMKSLPLTQSGKLDRNSLPEPDILSLTSMDSYVAPSTPSEKRLAEIWGQVLGIDQVGVQDNFFELGGDSILSIQIVSKANQAGLRITPKHMFEHQTIAELVNVMGEADMVEVEQGKIEGSLPLLPIQKWFFEQNVCTPHHFNQSVLLTVRQALDQVLLQRAIGLLLVHHDALRLRFEKTHDGWQQTYGELDGTIPFSVVNLSGMSEDEQTKIIELEIAKAQASLNFSDGPLMQVVYFDLGAKKQARLLWVIHHLAVDGISWRILLEDLQTVYQQLSLGREVQLPPKTTSYQQWAQQLEAFAKSNEMKEEHSFWLDEKYRTPFELPVDDPNGKNTGTTIERITMSLSKEETDRLLHKVPLAYQTQINDVLLTALVQATTKWTGTSSLLVNLEGHGREEIGGQVHLSRTVGWFTSLYPVLLDLSGIDKHNDALNAIKEQLHCIPNKGVGYGVLRYLSEDDQVKQKLQGLPQAQISFNYLGQFDKILSDSELFTEVKELVEESIGPDTSRYHMIDVIGLITDGQFQIQWVYSKEMYNHSHMEQVARYFIEALGNLIDHCTSLNADGYTESDFPLAEVSSEKIDQLLGMSPPIEDIYPMTPLQHGMLFHALYSSNAGDYVTQIMVDFQGKLRVPIFERAWRYVINRHAILRITFIWEGLAKPHQIIRKNACYSLIQQDWRGMPYKEQEERFLEYLRKDRKQDFDFSSSPMRFVLFRMTDESYRFVWSHHHILLDGWSLPIVLNEVLRCYEAFCNEQEVQLDAPRSFANYINWLQQQDLKEAEKFWRKMLQGFAAPTPLLGRKCSSIQGSNKVYSEHTYQFSEEKTIKLKFWAKKNQITFNTLIQGAWAYLLSRYSGEEDVVFGVTTSGRSANLPDIEMMVGLFINTLPMRVYVPKEASLVSWLQELQVLNTGIRQYEHSSLVDVQKWSDVPPGTSLFESFLVFESYPLATAADNPVDELKVQGVRGFEQTHYPLGLQVFPNQKLTLKLMYDRGRFTDRTIKQMMRHLQLLLENMATDAKQNLSQLSFLTESEYKQLLVEFNDTKVEYVKDKTINGLFEEQAKKTPYAVAVVFEEKSFTYRELNERANRLAHYLQKQGVGPEVLVGIHLNRSLDMIVSMLGILKAGGTYLPIDPEYPQERINYMLQDSKVNILITQQNFINKEFFKGTLLVLDDIELCKESVFNPINTPAADKLAYVIYTSGSTGKPKGVMIEHRSVVNLITGIPIQITLLPNRSLLSLATISFDMFVLEVFLPLTKGLRLVIANEEQQRDANLLCELIKRQHIDVLHVTPSRLWLLLNKNDPSHWKSISLVMVGGEAVPYSLIEKIRGVTNARIYNMYGPTESTVWSAVKDVTEGEEIQIGKPIANTKFYVLNQQMQLVPIGVPGELYIGGDGLARGYMNRSELTAERFIPNPFNDESGSRLYKTGDLVRYLPDGNIEYIGRMDNQVKIRGYRIELGEIETALGTHPTVQETVVIAREEITGDKRLIAYVVPSPKAKMDTRDLRSHLREKVPEYMIPSAFVSMESLPLTPNGKIDRKALLNSNQPSQLVRTCEYIAPRNPMEERMVKTWKEVLRIETVGIQDNFFELGGHSLLATQLVSRLGEEFDVELPLRVLFENPTVATLTEQVSFLRHNRQSMELSYHADHNKSKDDVLVKIQSGSTGKVLFLVHPVGGDVVSYIKLARELGDHTVYGLQSRGLVNNQQPIVTIEEMVSYYLEAIQTVQTQGPYLLGGWSMGGLVAFEIAQQLQKAGEKVDMLALFDTVLPGQQKLRTKLKHIVDTVNYGARKFNFNSRRQRTNNDDRKDTIFNFSLEQMKRRIRVYRANMKACGCYTPQVYNNSIVLFRTSDTNNGTNGWEKHVREVNVIDVPGNHFTMLDSPNVKDLGEKLRDLLDQ
ncbi:amino acid adenylation domain-containing protein [Bacillus subtilis]|uniref:amino acid adenylation domain-containing protein n=1 Tax=Bacillus subtilis TaxID=1423 RepID=UPI001D086682|nr:non-ribosomal peptide synthetase [Bacillus subtilis]MCB7162458.1 amino acid adenylation domain-containing protein [Bacillus subtilis]MCB7461325.1 amino acid adenylation domain-containing protein [Bacillus subtilis]